MMRWGAAFLVLVTCACAAKKKPEVESQQQRQAQMPAVSAAAPDPSPAPAPADPPLVGINGVNAGMNCESPDSRCSDTENVRASLENAGTRWKHLMADGDYDVAVRSLLDGVDCLVLRGGNDIDPARFGERKLPSFVPLSKERESFDFALVQEALRRKMPVLGICLGAQEVNVALKGDLVQDIPSEMDDELDHRQDHPIQTVPKTLVSEIYGESVMVHSNHHQSVDAMGSGLRVSATASDGVIEAFEAADRSQYPFLVGVQYHPEFEIGTEHDKLFAAFKDACKEYKAQRPE